MSRENDAAVGAPGQLLGAWVAPGLNGCSLIYFSAPDNRVERNVPGRSSLGARVLGPWLANGTYLPKQLNKHSILHSILQTVTWKT